MGTPIVTGIVNPPTDLVGVVWVTLNGSHYTMEYNPAVDRLPIPRRVLVRGLRQLADAWEAEAEKVGD